MSRVAIDEPRTWQRIRRYAVPAAMIAECAAARAAGDWRAACAAGRIDVNLDLAAIARAHGPAAAATIEADLAALAPDLLRWHLPRVLGGRTGIATHGGFLLSTRTGRLDEGDPFLVVHTPKTVDGSQRLRLTVETSFGHHIDMPPAYWSHAHVGDLAAAYGGSAARMPGFEADGSVRPDEAYATEVDPDDPATRTEFAERRLDDDRAEDAWRAQGLALEYAVPTGRKDDQVRHLTAIALGGLAAECHRLAARYGVSVLAYGNRWDPPLRIDRAPDGRLSASILARNAKSNEARRMIPELVVTRPIDLDLLRAGLIQRDDLHPLVRSALFPAASETPGAPDDLMPLDVAVPVRCGREWHTVTHTGGRLTLTSHTADEIRREDTLKALGGASHGCFAARSAWRGGPERLPAALRRLRRDAWLRTQHGGARVLTELLDAGLDPLVTDGRGNTLLHQLRAVDHTEVLPRLLAAGVPINARNRIGRTPLHVAVGDGGSPELVEALLAAGADPMIGDRGGTTTVEMSGWKAEARYDDEPDAEDPHPQARIHRLLLERTAK